jgi:hypothetical protein
VQELGVDLGCNQSQSKQQRYSERAHRKLKQSLYCDYALLRSFQDLDHPSA